MAKQADPGAIADKYNELKSDRGTYLSHLQEIANLVAPSQASVLNQLTEGGKRTENIYDGVQMRSLDNFANGLFGNLTPVASPWFALACRNKSINELPAVKWWLQDTTERMRAAVNSSNAGMALFTVLKYLGWAGSAVLYIGKGTRYTVSFTPINPAFCVWEEDPEGIVDSMYTCQKYTARQAIQQWGDKVGPEIKKAYINLEHRKQFDIIHACYPRNDYDWNKKDAINMKYASVYLEKESKLILNESGYEEFPFAVPRWDKADGETTGRSPAMNALPDIKQLMQVVYDSTMAHQMWVRPPVLASKESALSTTRITPGKIIYHRSGEKPEPWPMQNDLRISIEEKNSLRDAIRQAFFNDLFIVLQDNVPGRTAFEIRQMVEEKMNILGPFLSRMMVELLDVMLNRTFWIMYRGGFINQVPQDLVNQGIETEYTGRLAIAMRRYETSATQEALALTQQIAQIDPTVVDNWNLDEVVVGTAQRNAVPIKYIRPAADRDQLRTKRQQAQQAAEAGQSMMDMAGQVPALSKAPEEGSPVDAMMKAAAGGQ